MEKTFSSLSFQSLILSYLWKNQTSFKLSLLLKKEYFEDPRCAEIFKWIEYFSKTHGTPISKVMMRDILSKPAAIPTSLKLFEVILKSTLSQAESSYVQEQVSHFCRFQSVLDVLVNKAAPLMDKGDLTQLETLLQDSFSVGQQNFSPGMRYFDDTQIKRRIKDRVLSSTRDYFSTWIAELDHILKFRRGQIGVVIGNSGRGKTMFLIYMAKILLMQKLNVVYYTLQLPEDEIASRMDAAMSNLKMAELKDNPLQVTAGVHRFRKSFNANFIIKGFSTQQLTVPTLRSHIDLLKSEGFTPDVVLMDYGNLMATEPGRKRRETSRYEELGSIYEEMMALSQERDIFSLIGHQSKQTSWDKPVLSISDAAESSLAVMVSPLVITLNRNLQDEALGQARVYVAKNTYGRDGVLVTIPTAFDRGLYYAPWNRLKAGTDGKVATSEAVAPTTTLTAGKKYRPKKPKP